MPSVPGPVLVVGATGFLGRRVVRQLRALHVPVTVAVRDPARAGFGPHVEVVRWDGTGPLEWQGKPRAVVNLAGAPIAGKRWSAAYKREMEDSRLGTMGRVVDWIRSSGAPVETLVAASAVGYYGERVDTPVTEDSPAGTDYLARLCADWEAAASRAESSGVRVVSLRFGVLLGPEGGALTRLEPIYRLGAGGPILPGRQPFAWMHVKDAARAVLFALATPALRGPVNAVAPELATYRDFSRALAKALRRPNLAFVPPLALRIAFGEAAGVLTGGQAVVPKRLQAAGFTWLHPHLAPALVDVYTNPESPRPVVNVREGTLDHAFTLDASPEEVWAFFSDPRNLSLLTPEAMGFDVGAVPETAGKGTRLDHTLKLGPFRTRWRSHLSEWQPPTHFQDTQEKGPYRWWVHDHHFEPAPVGTRNRDHVAFRLPLGFLGRLGGGAYVRWNLDRVFAYRYAALERRFGLIEDPALSALA